MQPTQPATLPGPIRPHDLHQRMRAGDVLLVDVREPDEHRDWRIPGSVNVPLDELAHGASVPTDRPVVVYCATGPRSVQAQRILADRGIAAPYLAGGMTAWNGVYEHTALSTPQGAQIVQLQRVGKGCLSYLVVNDGEALVIDPTVDVREYVDAAAARGARIVAILDTHAHADHASGSRALAEISGAPYYAPPEVGALVPHTDLVHGDEIRVGRSALRVLATPGHTPGSLTFLYEDVAFTGDTLFVDGVGRPDLGQDPARTGHTLWRTLRERVLALPPGTRILPGHRGEASPGTSAPVVARLEEVQARTAALSMDEDAFVAWVARNALPKPANFETIKKLNLGLARVAGPDEIRALEAGPNRCAVAE